MPRWLWFAPVALAVTFCGPPGPGAAAPRSEAARWLQEYLSLDTRNPPGREHLGARFLGTVLKSEGIPYELLATPDGRTNLVARLRAPGPAAAALVLLHHMDVVDPGPGWTHDPFGGEIAAGRLWGRGALDAKGLGIAQLAAFVSLHRAGGPQRRDVIFLAVADEEGGGIHGTQFVLESYPDRLANTAAVLNEGGANRLVNGNFLWWGIEVAQKRPLWLEVTAVGRGGHAAGFNNHSSTHRLVRGLARIADRPLQWRVSAPVRSYLQALAPLHNDYWREIFSDVDRFIQSDGPTASLMPGMGTLFLDTVQITVLEGSAQINVSPPEARARLDVRLLPDTDAEGLLDEIRSLLGNEATLEVLLTAPPSPPSSTDDEVYRLLAEELDGEAPVVPFFSAGFTDSRFFRERSIPAYGFYPFALEPSELRGIHGADESLSLAELDRGVERFRRVVSAWASGGA